MEYANYIARCIEIARRGEYFVAPNPMVGAVLVHNSDEKILAEGWHEKYGEAHAEVNCFNSIQNSKFKISRIVPSLSRWSLAAITARHRRARS